MFLSLPGGNTSLMRLTAEGRQKEAAMPEKERKAMIWAVFLDSPQAIVERHCRKQPDKNMRLLPMTSETEPQARRVQPQAREYTVTGLKDISDCPEYSSDHIFGTYHSTRLSGMLRSLAMMGIAIVMTPARKDAMPVLKAMQPMTMALPFFEACRRFISPTSKLFTRVACR
jgi:hypothetical protein